MEHDETRVEVLVPRWLTPTDFTANAREYVLREPMRFYTNVWGGGWIVFCPTTLPTSCGRLTLRLPRLPARP